MTKAICGVSTSPATLPMPGSIHTRLKSCSDQRKPAPKPRTGEAERSRGDDCEIEIERPIIRGLSGDDQRCEVGANETEAYDGRPMKQGCRKRGERHNAEKQKGGAGIDEAVKREAA